MATEITMPQFGESVHEGTVGKWLKQAGERVEKYEPLVEIVTDKVTVEVPSPVAGTVARIVVEEGATVTVGETIAVVEERVGRMAPPPGIMGADTDGAQLEVSAATPSQDVAPSVREQPPVKTNGHSRLIETDQETVARKRSSPIVRRIALEHDVDIQQLQGTGLGGRVTKLDVLRFLAQRGQVKPVGPPAGPDQARAAPSGPGGWRPANTPAPEPRAPAVGVPANLAAPPSLGLERDGDVERVPLTPMRRAIADFLTRSTQTIPHAWTMLEVDVSRLVALRHSIMDTFQRREGVHLTVFPFMISAVVRAVKQYPAINAGWVDGGIVRHRRTHVGMAVSLGDDGLVVPVIRDADQRNVAGLAHAVHDLATRARSGKLGVDDLQGATITVNNPGAFGSVLSAPIIPQGQTAIVTMEAIIKRPIVIDDAIAIRSMMNVCCSFDHRVIDGETAGRFLIAIKRELESIDRGTAVY